MNTYIAREIIFNKTKNAYTKTARANAPHTSTYDTQHKTHMYEKQNKEKNYNKNKYIFPYLILVKAFLPLYGLDSFKNFLRTPTIKPVLDYILQKISGGSGW